MAQRWRVGGRKADVLVASAAGLLYALISRTIFFGKPLLTDEIIQLFQARIFASGRLWAPASPYPEFTSAMNLLDWGGKVYGQFPAGGPAMLAIGTLLHAEWLVGPVAAALGVFVFARLLRIVESRHGVALAALLLFAFAPFCAFLDGSMMNHVTTVTWLLVAALALAIATRTEVAVRSRRAGDGVRARDGGHHPSARRGRRSPCRRPSGWRSRRAWRACPTSGHCCWSGVGIAIPLAALLAVNAAQTGHPLLFGYIAMWGKSHALGFHEAPWGFPAHAGPWYRTGQSLSPAVADLVPRDAGAGAALCHGRPRAHPHASTAFDRYVLAGSGLLLLAYFAYWHDGFYLGPRFMLPLAPWLALWTARLPAALAERRIPLLVQRMVLAGGIAPW